ncbi:hypothetical protein [Limoniibacter endophyticus]|uniref:Uncharacterized protein n=1 Tax=Limoniibacter endophyticus TaxID=1565040 RepID=A0A8J3GHA1_9HYPH|nr:hypothetical protein [Limoniibacter endophyticus]GHC70164.1 hypothetical protein GCM10010136_16210 [Limoniibacter endophyticus]
MSEKHRTTEAPASEKQSSINLYDPWERHFVSQNKKDAFYRSLENRPASSSTVSR